MLGKLSLLPLPPVSQSSIFNHPVFPSRHDSILRDSAMAVSRKFSSARSRVTASVSE
jgi:hypothetical protein